MGRAEDLPGMEPSLAATPTQLLDVAERLFANQGIDNVSIREIVRASGQSNLSAAHYHFGSREAMVGALLARRIRAINVIRHQRLDALEAAARDNTIHAIVGVTIGALGEVVKSTSWGRDHVRVAAQVILSPNNDVQAFLDPDTMSGQIRCTAMLRRLLPQLRPQVFKDRIWILNNEATYSMARWINAHGPVTASNGRRFGVLLRNTADFLAAGLAAPVGEPATEDELDAETSL